MARVTCAPDHTAARRECEFSAILGFDIRVGCYGLFLCHRSSGNEHEPNHRGDGHAGADQRQRLWSNQGASMVNFNGAYSAAIVSWSDTQIVATVPPQAFSGQVVVTVGGVCSNQTVYFNVPGPQVTSISPTSGGVGTQVTVNGSGFQSPKGRILPSVSTASLEQSLPGMTRRSWPQ